MNKPYVYNFTNAMICLYSSFLFFYRCTVVLIGFCEKIRSRDGFGKY